MTYHICFMCWWWCSIGIGGFHGFPALQTLAGSTYPKKPCNGTFAFPRRQLLRPSTKGWWDQTWGRMRTSCFGKVRSEFFAQRNSSWTVIYTLQNGEGQDVAAFSCINFAGTSGNGNTPQLSATAILVSGLLWMIFFWFILLVPKEVAPQDLSLFLFSGFLRTVLLLLKTVSAMKTPHWIRWFSQP